MAKRIRRRRNGSFGSNTQDHRMKYEACKAQAEEWLAQARRSTMCKERFQRLMHAREWARAASVHVEAMGPGHRGLMDWNTTIVGAWLRAMMRCMPGEGPVYPRRPEDERE